MLQRLRIKNFQAHQKRDLLLDQVTCLVGRSDVGKSAVLRSIRWALANKPSGAEFITDGADECEVRLLIDGQTVKRIRGKQNTYMLGPKSFAAFGNGVPDDIADLANVDHDLNFQDQHDPVFWLSQSPSEVGRQLNAIVDLESVDKVQQEMGAKVRKLKSTMDVTEDELRECQTEIEALAFVRDASRWVESLDSLKANIEQHTTACEFLDELLVEMQQHAKVLSDAQGLGDSFDEIAAAYEGWRQVEKDTKRLATLVTDGLRHQKDCRYKIPTSFDKLEESYKTIAEQRKEVQRLQALIDDHGMTAIRVQSIQSELTQAEKEMEKVQVCPTCGQLMPSQS